MTHPPTDGGLPGISFAFQPIIDAEAERIYSYEALIRGPAHQLPGAVFAGVPSGRLHEFDGRARCLAIELAASLGLDCHLNLNFLPQSVLQSDAPLQETIAAAEHAGIEPQRLILEVTESEVITDHPEFAAVINRFRGMGVRVAIDDFGAGFSGLNLLAEFQPDIIKLDMKLVRGIERSGPRQAIVRAIIQACTDLGIDVLAEGVETLAEYRWFRQHRVQYFQGFLLGRPGYRTLPAATFPLAAAMTR